MSTKLCIIGKFCITSNRYAGLMWYKSTRLPSGNTMADPKPLYDMSDRELAELMRNYPRGIHPTYGDGLGAENERRQVIRNRRLTLAAVIFAAVSAFCSAAAAIASYITIYLKLNP